MRCKLFEIGYSWSGTKSLAKAIHILSKGKLEIRHGLKYIGRTEERSKWKKDALCKTLVGSCEFDVYNHYDVALDFPSIHWKQLAKKYPDARFILSLRDISEWTAKKKRRSNKGRINRKIRKILEQPITYGELSTLIRLGSFFHRDSSCLEEKLEAHQKEVVDYFKKTDRLLVLDILRDPDEVTWKKLADFMGVESPSIPFPCVRHNQWQREVQ